MGAVLSHYIMFVVTGYTATETNTKSNLLEQCADI